MSAIPFADLNALAAHFRNELAPPPPQNPKKFILLYAYNGTGKTRLSTAFKDIAKQAGQADTLCFNAFTEDLFSWHNDLVGDSERYLILHPSSNFFLSHGKYSLYEPKEMGDDTRAYFRTILYAFLKDYPFNPTLFQPLPVTAATPAAPPVKAPAKASKKTAPKAPATPPTS